MMYQGFAGEYEAPSSRCSSASPAGDSLTYYPSPADSFSSMGSPVNSQVRAVARPPRGSVLGVPGRRWARGAAGRVSGRVGAVRDPRGAVGFSRAGGSVRSGRGAAAGRAGGAGVRAARCGACVKRLH